MKIRLKFLKLKAMLGTSVVFEFWRGQSENSWTTEQKTCSKQYFEFPSKDVASFL